MKSRKIIRPWKRLALIAFAAILIGSCSSRTNENLAPIDRGMVPPPSELENLEDPFEVKNTAEQINKGNFDLIKNGMSFLEVEILIAAREKKITSVNKEGVLKETFRWETEDGTKYIEVLFENDKVVGKNQKGLK